jgi:glutamine phosphoribosylpyrophosphate amidotransferase
MMQAVGSETGKGYCSACFTGKYPVALGQNADLVQLRRARV